MTPGEQTATDAFLMFEKWCEMFAPADFDGDELALAMLYAQAPFEQHAEAASVLGLKRPA